MAGPLSSVDFRRIWIGNLFAGTGGIIQIVGATWLMASMSPSPQLIALVQTASNLPLMFLSAIGGILADARDRRTLMILCNAFMVGGSLLLVGAQLLEILTPGMLLILILLINSGGAVNHPSWQASVGDLVPRSQVSAAVAINSFAYNISRTVAPALGGFLLSGFGALAALIPACFGYFVAVISLCLWQRGPNTAVKANNEGCLVLFSQGLAYVRNNGQARRIVARGIAFGLCSICMQALLPSITIAYWSSDPSSYGVLLAVFGLGAIIGSGISALARQHGTYEVVLRSGFLLLALALIGAAQLLTSWGIAACVFVCGFTYVVMASTLNVSMLLSAPASMVGRSMSIYQTAAFGSMSLGAWMWGAISDVINIETALFCSAGLALVGCLVGAVFPINGLLPVYRTRG